ncbi:hypothetical protein GUJ93_ZPchr0007g3658 [Zizania palustris]|uniref:Pentatricopeptide repeat-containing protein n=1 Tax=Zizania palustris TaxID=103762 RepID=A0A8J5TEZ3_ZIZPA|nr:hypothetical protein GUJ93_ZPchr0007g3658 [Zizania palustris]
MSPADGQSRMYAEAGDMGAARAVFDGMPRRDAVSWSGSGLGDAVEPDFWLCKFINSCLWKGSGLMHAIVIK